MRISKIWSCLTMEIFKIALFKNKKQYSYTKEYIFCQAKKTEETFFNKVICFLCWLHATLHDVTLVAAFAFV